VKLKLDENIGRRGLELLKGSGHNVMTVHEQSLGGAADEELFEVCATEGRALITLDKDFGQVLRFPPERSAGIIVLEIGPRAGPQGILDRLRDFLAVLETRSVAGELWIVEPGRVRIHLRDGES
jgi:predicted nuclease of predicted toxin-antitoxin system